jgi:hypothetical protein
MVTLPARAGRRARLGRTPGTCRPCAGEPEGFGGFSLSEAREKPELHKVRADGVLTIELFEGLIECEEVDVWRFAGNLIEIDLHPLTAAPAFETSLAAGAVEDNPARGLGRGGEAVTAAVPGLALVGTNQPEVRLMHQGRGLESLT